MRQRYAGRDFGNTLEFALEMLHLHRNEAHYGRPGPLIECMVCRGLEDRVKLHHKHLFDGAVPQYVVPGREIEQEESDIEG